MNPKSIINQSEISPTQDDQKQVTKVAVIGCGYVGKAVANHWYQQGYLVTGTTTREEKVSELEGITHHTLVMTGDNLSAIEQVLENQDTILVSIAPISDRQVDAEIYAQTYLPTANNLATALTNNSSVKQLIYISSASVYGDKNGELVDETSSLDTDSDYGKILVEAEQIILGIPREDLHICILRLGGIYGAGRELDQRLGKLAGKMLPGRSNDRRAWIHLDDVVAGIEFIHQHRCYGIYNLVNDVQLTTKELCDLICDRQNLERITWDENKSSFSSLNARVDNSKIKQEGYQFIYGDQIV
jgi:nucleoside-diphosphate-sugar epimerase